MKNRIKLLRKTLKLSQTEFAEKLGMTMRAIQKWEAGEVEIKISSLKLLEKVFNANIDWLINGTGDMILNNNSNKNDINDENIKSLSITYNLPQKFLKLVFQLNQNELERVEGYIEALIENRKIYEKERQRLSS